MAPLDDRPTVIRPADTPPIEPPPLPHAIGGFRIQREIGRGGMGVVYAAHDPQLGRAVAVKVMRADWADGPVYRERFLREARAAGGLHHDHIVPVYQSGEDAAGLFLVMPLLAGRPLDVRLEAGPVPLAEAIEIGRQAAEGLAAAHAAGLVHRDVKPANLFLEDRPGGVRVRLLDFGVARSAADAPGLTGPGGVVGTPAYMAPEQAWGQPADHRADLFSLGCILYHLCSGKPPPTSGPDFLMSRLNPSKLPAPRAVNPAVPGGLCDLIRRLMANDPEERPDSAGDVAGDLAKVAAGLGKPPAKPRRRWPVVAAVAVLAVGGLAVAQVVLRTEKDGKTTQQTVPSGSVITVGGDGKVTVEPPANDPGKPPTGWKAGQTLPPPATDYEVLFDADLDGLAKWADGLAARKRRPDALSCRETPAGRRYTAVAVADGRRGEAWIGLDLPGTEWWVKARPLMDAGLRPVSYGGTIGPGAALPMAFWAHAGPPTRQVAVFVQRSPTELRKMHTDHVAKGYRLTRIVSFGPPATFFYGMAYGPNRPSFAHDFAVDLSQASLEAEAKTRAADGFRLDALDATGTAAGPAFHAVWVRDGGTSDFTLDLTREQLDKLLASRREARSQPYTLAGYDTPSGVRYAVVWVPMAPREVAPMPRAGGMINRPRPPPEPRVTPEVKLIVTLAGLTVGLFAFFWGIALFLQGYLYSQIADRIPVRALVSAVLVACGLTGWTFLNTRASHTDKYGVLVGFDRMMTPTTSQEVGEFEAVRQLQTKDEKGQPREQKAKFVWDGRDKFVEAESKAEFKLNTSTYLTTALLVPDAGGTAKFDAVLDNGRYTPEKQFKDPAGRTIEGTAPRTMQVPSPGAMMVGLAVNAGCLVLWLVAFWLGMRFAFGHAFGLTAVFGLACILVLMPLLFNANTIKPGVGLPAAKG